MADALAALFLTNRWQPVDQARFRRLVHECGDSADCFLIADARTAITEAEALAAGGAGTYVFDVDALPAALGYRYWTPKGIMPGCMHFPIIDFARRRHYEKYLLIENDLEFTGDWADLAALCRQGDFDLMASHVYAYEEKPQWALWNCLRDHEGTRPPTSQLLKAFLPCACYSRRALLHAHDMHLAGWKGHFEILVPTLLILAGMVVSDLNAWGHFYVGTEQNPQPSVSTHALSTLRWRPPIELTEFQARFHPGVLYHPVKDQWMWVGGEVSQFGGDADRVRP